MYLEITMFYKKLLKVENLLFYFIYNWSFEQVFNKYVRFELTIESKFIFFAVYLF
jgi:hypothetical protein